MEFQELSVWKQTSSMLEEKEHHMWQAPEEDHPACPNCGSERVARILWGLPDFSSASLQLALEEKRVVLGGCCVWSTCPKWFCNACRHTWGRGMEGRERGR